MSTNVLRIHRTTGFTVVPDTTIRDRALSFRARGVLAYLLSMADGWEHGGATGLAEQTPLEGRDALRTALSELEDAGYLKRVATQDDRGRWSTAWHVGDQPTPDEPTSVEPSLTREPSKGTISRRNRRERPPKAIADDWEPSDADLAWCGEHYPHLDPWPIAREFRSYWLGRGDKRANWSWTFRNWVQKIAARSEQRGPARTFL